MKYPFTMSDTSVPGSAHHHIRGQGLTEYIIILSLVVIAAIGATSFFGDSVKASFVALGSELTGGTRYDMNKDTQNSLKKAQGSVTTATTLKNYRD